MAATYGIAELAREFGITMRAIRYYEDHGLIEPVRAGQRRVYTARDRVRLRLIMRGKRLGFSLFEIREMLDMYDADRSEVAQLHLVLERIAGRRASLRQQQRDIEAMLRELDEAEAQCRSRLDARLTPAPPKAITS
jgi:DNA-binding transcriptional MerR regulator